MRLDFAQVATQVGGNRIGECVLWDDARDEMVWTNIPSRRLWRRQIGERKELPEELASFALMSLDGTSAHLSEGTRN